MKKMSFAQFKKTRKKATISSFKKLKGGEKLNLVDYNFYLEIPVPMKFIFHSLEPVTDKQKKYFSHRVQGKCKVLNNLPLVFDKKTGELRYCWSSDVSELYWDETIKISPRSSKKEKTNRPSPSESATHFKVGTKKKGNDGQVWKVIKASNGSQRWQRQ